MEALEMLVMTYHVTWFNYLEGSDFSSPDSLEFEAGKS
jgi:hypothetical protein